MYFKVLFYIKFDDKKDLVILISVIETVKKLTMKGKTIMKKHLHTELHGIVKYILVIVVIMMQHRPMICVYTITYTQFISNLHEFVN